MSLGKGIFIKQYKSPTCYIYGLGLFLLFILKPVLSTGVFQKKSGMVQQGLVVAKINAEKNKDYAEVVFLRSARFYKLMKKSKHYDHYLELLKGSEKSSMPVIVARNSEYSDTIEEVKSQK